MRLRWVGLLSRRRAIPVVTDTSVRTHGEATGWGRECKQCFAQSWTLLGGTLSDDGKQWLLMMLVSALAVAAVSGGAVVLFELHR